MANVITPLSAEYQLALRNKTKVQRDYDERGILWI